MNQPVDFLNAKLLLFIHGIQRSVGGDGDTYVRNFQVHGAIGVQDIVEETAVVVVASEFGLESSLVFQRGGGGGQLGLEVLSLRCTVGQSLVQLAHSIVVVDLLAVVVGHSLLLIIGLIVQVGARIGAVFVGHVEWEGERKEIKMQQEAEMKRQ